MSFEQLRARQRADYRDAAAPKPRVFVLNRTGANPVEMTKLVSVSFGQVMNDIGQCTVTVELDDVSCGVLADAHPDAAVPLVIQVGMLETAWFATHVTETYVGNDETITVTCVSPEKHLQQMFGWPNPDLLPEAQISKIKVRVGPIARLIKDELLAPNFKRMGRKVGGQVHYVAQHEGADDYTRQTIIGIQMNEALDMIKSLIDSEGLTLTYKVYLPGRGQTPPPGHRKECMAIIWNVEHRAELPAGGLLFHGLVRSVSEFWKDVWETLSGFSSYNAAESVEYWGKPQMILRHSQYDDLEITSVKPTASTYTVGGKSQDWLNDIISAGIRAAIQAVTGPLGIIVDALGLDGILDDRFLAYHSFDDHARRNRMGPMGFFEAFNPSIGLSLDALLLLREAQYKTRAARTHDVSLGGSGAFTPGEEFGVGTMLALELPRERYVVSFVTEINYSYTVEDDARWTIQVADRPRRSSSESALMALRGVATMVNKLTLTE